MPVETLFSPSRRLSPETVPAQPAGTRAKPWWLWPHLLGLDAPLVAVIWQWWWVRCAHVRLAWFHPVVLGFAVWLIYLTDRLADASRAVPGDPVTSRHAFHFRWRTLLSVCAVAVASGLALLTPLTLSSVEFFDGLLFLCPALVYFWLIHGRRGQAWTAFLPKEAAVGVLFALGTAFFPWCRHGLAGPGLLAAVALFGGLCFCNCALITGWERHAQDVRNPASLLNAFPGLTARLPQGCFVLGCAAGGSAMLTGSAALLPLSASGFLLAVLDRHSGKLSPDAVRVLADAALLTPLLGLYRLHP